MSMQPLHFEDFHDEANPRTEPLNREIPPLPRWDVQTPTKLPADGSDFSILLDASRVAELRRAADEIDMKVSYFVRDGVPEVWMRDSVFTDFVRAAKFISRVADTEMPSDGHFIG